MLNCWYVIVIALSIYHVVNAGKFTRQCMASKGRCGRKKDSTCENMFGSGWTEKGSCCKKRPCCVFQCENIQSDILPNGIVNVIERNVGSTANFYCNEGYLLDGNQSITCSQSRLNGETPQCRFHCGDIQFDSLPNGLVTLMERHVGSTANFSCNEGYLLDGNQSITCTQSGWNGETPQCRFQCKDIPPDSLTNGTVTVTERNVGSAANLSCDAGHSVVGNESITCTESGWNGNIPQCRCQLQCGGQLTSIETNDENTFLLDVIALLKSIHEVRDFTTTFLPIMLILLF